MTDPDHALIPSASLAVRALVDLETAAKLTGMHPEMIFEFAKAGLTPVAKWESEALPQFDDDGIYRLRQIEYLRTHQQVHLRTIRLIVQLLDRTETAERELRRLREQFR